MSGKLRPIVFWHQREQLRDRPDFVCGWGQTALGTADIWNFEERCVNETAGEMQSAQTCSGNTEKYSDQSAQCRFRSPRSSGVYSEMLAVIAFFMR